MTTRRSVISYLTLAAIAGAFPARGAETPSPEYFEKHTAPAEASFFISNAPKDERGDRMVIRGLVTDGKTPIPGASIYIYHTDREGRYDPLEARPGYGRDNPRLHAYLRSDSVGRYVYGSVRPGPIPNTPDPARVHVVVSAEGFKSRAFDIWFDGDPSITPEQQAIQEQQPDRIYILRAVRDSNRVFQIGHDIMMERK